MILTITLNPCIDKSSAVARLQPESKLRCSEVLHEPGGGGINVSKALKKLHTPSLALFPAGGHNGNMLQSLLQKEEINYKAIDTLVETRENWVVLEAETNQQFRFTFPGLAVEEAAIHALVEEMSRHGASWIVVSGSLPPGLPATFYGWVVQKAKAMGARCIVDTSGPALEALKGQGAYLIKPNIGELCKLLNIEHLDKNEVPAAAQQVIKNGYAQLLAISMGPEGAWLVGEHEQHFAKAPKVEKRSTVGAGDSMVAGITHMLQKNASLAETIQFGVACGSAATMNHGTQLFQPDDVRRLYDMIRLSEHADSCT